MAEPSVFDSPDSASTENAKPVIAKKAHSGRIYSLDILRFLAAVSVMCYHVFARSPEFTGLKVISGPTIFQYGYLGVDAFFLLSGFIIAWTSITYTPRAFFASRVSRIAPAFMVCCTLTFAVVYFALRKEDVGLVNYLGNVSLWVITPLQYLKEFKSVDGVYWTLLAESHFYCIFAIFLLPATRRFLYPFIYFWLAMVLLIEFSPIHGAIFTAGKILFMQDRASYFIAGLLFALTYQKRPQIQDLAAFGLTLWIAVRHAWHRSDRLNKDYGYVLHHAGVAALLISFYAIFALVAYGRFDEQRWKPFAYLGALTYPIYLLHQMISYAIISHVGPITTTLVAAFIAIASVVLLAIAVHHGVERPIGRPLRKWLEGRSQPSATS